MKKYILIALVTMAVLSGCSIFKRKEGCPTSGAAIGAEQLLSGDAKAIRKSSKARFKVKSKYQ
jgi:hypothetical protein